MTAEENQGGTGRNGENGFIAWVGGNTTCNSWKRHIRGQFFYPCQSAIILSIYCFFVDKIFECSRILLSLIPSTLTVVLERFALFSDCEVGRISFQRASQCGCSLALLAHFDRSLILPLKFFKPVSSTPLITFGVVFLLKENLDLNFSSIITWWASLIHLILSPLHAGTWHFRQNSWTLSCCVLSFSALLEFSLVRHWVTARSWRSKI